MVRLWGRDERFALKDAAIAAAMDRSLNPSDAARPGERPGPIEIGVDLDVPPAEALVWFCDPNRWTRFQGREASLDPRPGGRLRIDLGDGVIIVGHYVNVDQAEVSFTWGMENNPSLPAESTRVTVTAMPRGSGCELTLRHEGLVDTAQALSHRSGWRYHLLRLAVAASGVSGETEMVELFLAAATEHDETARRGLLRRACGDQVELAEGLEHKLGIADVAAYLGKSNDRGVYRLVRTGEVQRLGLLLRCGYAVRQAGGGGPADDRRELVAVLDSDYKFKAISLFA